MEVTLSGAPIIAASRAHVWRRLMDPEAVARSTPGVETVERLDEHRYAVHSALSLGAIQVRLALQVELHDLVEPASAEMRLTGTAHSTTLDIRSSVHLEELSPHRVRLDWRATTTVNGLLAQVGGKILEGAARMFTERFWTDFAARSAESYP